MYCAYHNAHTNIVSSSAWCLNLEDWCAHIFAVVSGQWVTWMFPCNDYVSWQQSVVNWTWLDPQGQLLHFRWIQYRIRGCWALDVSYLAWTFEESARESVVLRSRQMKQCLGVYREAFRMNAFSTIALSHHCCSETRVGISRIFCCVPLDLRPPLVDALEIFETTARYPPKN